MASNSDVDIWGTLMQRCCMNAWAKHNETLQAVREVRLLRRSASVSASAMFRMMNTHDRSLQ